VRTSPGILPVPGRSVHRRCAKNFAFRLNSTRMPAHVCPPPTGARRFYAHGASPRRAGGRFPDSRGAPPTPPTELFRAHGRFQPWRRPRPNDVCAPMDLSQKIQTHRQVHHVPLYLGAAHVAGFSPPSEALQPFCRALSRRNPRLDRWRLGPTATAARYPSRSGKTFPKIARSPRAGCAPIPCLRRDCQDFAHPRRHCQIPRFQRHGHPAGVVS